MLNKNFCKSDQVVNLFNWCLRLEDYYTLSQMKRGRCFSVNVMSEGYTSRNKIKLRDQE